MVDADARRALLQATLRFDALGQRIWRRLYARNDDTNHAT